MTAAPPAEGQAPYQYALIRAVPRVDRGELVNIGVVLYCQRYEFLGVQLHLDPDRLRALCPDADVDGIERAAQAMVEAAAEPTGSARESQGQAIRFGILTAPRSTAVQPSAVHPGLTADPARTLTALVRRLVANP